MDVKYLNPERTQELINEIKRRLETKGENISATATNTSFSLTDATNGRIQGLTVEGRTTNKNLIAVKTDTKTSANIEFTANAETGMVTANNTSNNVAAYGWQLTLGAGTYTLQGCPANGTLNSYTIEVKTETEYGQFICRDDGSGVTFTLNEKTTIYIYIRIASGYTANNLAFRPQLELGSTATAFEPYGIHNVGDNGFGVTSCGKNLIDLNGVIVNTTNHGITAVSSGDGKIKITGQAGQADINIWLLGSYSTSAPVLFTLKAGTYTVSGVRLFNGETSVSGKTAIDGTNTFVLNTDTPVTAVRVGQADTTKTYDITISPQLELGSTVTSFSPYTGSTASLTTGLPLCSVCDVKDEVDYNRGVIVKRTGKIVLDGTETGWGIDTNATVGQSGSKRMILLNAITGVPVENSQPFKGICDKLQVATASETYGDNDGTISTDIYGTTIRVRISGISTTEALTTYLASNSVTVVYELAEPYEIPMTTAEVTAYRNLRTFEDTTNITATDSPTMTVDYLLNTDNGQAVSRVDEKVHSHTQASDTITAMTGYSKPASTSAITTSDTLNEAIGKLEKGLDGITANTSEEIRPVLIYEGSIQSPTTSQSSPPNFTQVTNISDYDFNYVMFVGIPGSYTIPVGTAICKVGVGTITQSITGSGASTSVVTTLAGFCEAPLTLVNSYSGTTVAYGQYRARVAYVENSSTNKRTYYFQIYNPSNKTGTITPSTTCKIYALKNM